MRPLFSKVGEAVACDINLTKERKRDMSKNKVRRLFAGLLAGAMLVMAAGCSGDNSSSTASEGGETSGSTDSNFNAEGWPVVKEKVTLHVFGSRGTETLQNWDDYIMLQEMEDTTNVDIEWELVESSTYNDRKAVMLTSNDLPDVVKDGLTATEITRYASSGTIIPLDELQDQYAPYYIAAMDSDYGKEVAMRGCSTAPDGHRYTFACTGLAPWIGLNRIGAINTDWLEAVDMDMPTSLEELEEVLVAFKTQDPNGNGEADEIPLSWQGAVMGTDGAWDFGLNWLADSFGCPSPQNMMNVKDGEVYFVGATEEFKEFLKWLNSLSNQGLLDTEGFSQSGDQYTAKKTSETPVLGVASVWEIGDDFATMDAYDHYAYLDPLTGLNGEEATPYTTVYDAAIGWWAVTSACKNPEIAVRVADYFYEDPKRNLELIEGRMGDEVSEEEQIRQVPCTVCNNGEAYMVADPPEGVNTQTFRNKCCPSSGVPYYIPTEAYEKYQHLHYTDAKAEKIRNNKANPNADLETIPSLMLSEEESDTINQIQSTLLTETYRVTAEFVVNGGIDEGWDAYLAQLESMGVNDMVAAYQTAYDRFVEASAE